MTLSTVETTAGESTSHMAVKGTVPRSGPEENPVDSEEQKEEQKDKKEKEQKAKATLEKLIDTQKLVGSGFTHISRCKMCGWQTMQMDEASGKKLVLQHAMQHYAEIQAETHE